MFLHVPIGSVVGQSSLFQCQTPSEQSGQVSLPDIPDLYFNTSTIPSSDFEVLSRFSAHIYSVLSHNCSGNVTAIQYCYQFPSSERDATLLVFDILFIFNIEEMNFRFTIADTFVSFRSVPSDDICIERSATTTMCCDTFNLSAGQFEIPSTAFAYGVATITPGNIQLLAFSSSSTTYQVNVFRIPFPFDSEFTVTPEEQSVGGPVLLRFLIGTL